MVYYRFDKFDNVWLECLELLPRRRQEESEALRDVKLSDLGEKIAVIDGNVIKESLSETFQPLLDSLSPFFVTHGFIQSCNAAHHCVIC